MATARPFAKHTGSEISGTKKSGNISAVIPNNVNSFDFAGSGLKWYNGPEETGYIISFEGASRPTPDGSMSTLNFVRSTDLTDQSFIDLVAKLAGQSFVNSTNALAWLNNNGYHTTFEVQVGTTFGYTYISGSSYPLSSAGNSTLVIDNPTSLTKYIWLKGNSTYLTSGTNNGSASSAGLSGSPISISNVITGQNQTFNSGTYISIPPYTLNSQFIVTNTGVGSMQLTYTDTNTPTKTVVPAL